MSDSINIEVTYALPDKQTLLSMSIKPNSTVCLLYTSDAADDLTRVKVGNLAIAI